MPDVKRYVNAQNHPFRVKECTRGIKYMYRPPRKDHRSGREHWRKAFIRKVTSPIDIVLALTSQIARDQ